jgi:Arc/MetJ family transcription regulator
MSVPVPDAPLRSQLASRVLVVVLVGLFLLGTAGFVFAAIGPRADRAAGASPDPAPSPPSAALLRLALAEPRSSSEAPPAAGQAQATPEAVVGEAGTALGAVGELDPSASPGPTDPLVVPGSVEPPAEQVLATTPLVPVTGFWSARTGLTSEDVRRALRTGEASGFRRVIVEESIREALGDAAGQPVADSVASGDLARVERAASRGALGFVAATLLTPRLRALDVDGRSLFGNDRVRRLAGWPLRAELPLPPEGTWAQDEAWVLVAGGDSFTDRGVYDRVVLRGRGVGWPFDGGTARVTGKRCCDEVYGANVVPVYSRTGNKGLVRRLFTAADLAILNHESPITGAATFHRSGFTFGGRPDLTRIFTRAGIDWVSLANNHIKDYGTQGIVDTRRILRRYGIRFGGAGKDLAQARKVDVLEVAGVRVAVIPCVGVAPAAWAGPATSGGTPCKDAYMVPDIKRAVRTADVVIVFPHWGAEYTRRPSSTQRRLAARWVKAGAHLVLGAHSHVAGAMEDIEGVPVLYSMGNLIFDQHWSTPTMESFILEATFHGRDLVQLRLHPFINHDQSQPNLLDPTKGEGRLILRQMRAASSDFLDW